MIARFALFASQYVGVGHVLVHNSRALRTRDHHLRVTVLQADLSKALSGVVCITVLDARWLNVKTTLLGPFPSKSFWCPEPLDSGNRDLQHIVLLSCRRWWASVG